jgi:hypothetical protein
MVVLRSRFGTILVALAMVASAAVAGAMIGEVTGANAVVSSGEKPVMIDMTPTRGLDTRGAPYGPIGVATAAPIGAKGVLNLTLAGNHGIPADATAVQLNVTTLNATAETFLTLYGAGTPRPNASTMNPDVGMTQFNGAVIPLGAGGAISIYNHLGSVNVLIDITGYFVDHNHDPDYLEAPSGVRFLAGGTMTAAGTLVQHVGPIDSVTRTSTGVYRFIFSGISINQTSPEVLTSVLPVSSNTQCAWSLTGNVRTVRVTCTNNTGNPKNTSLAVTFHQITDGLGTLTGDVSDFAAQG